VDDRLNAGARSRPTVPRTTEDPEPSGTSGIIALVLAMLGAGVSMFSYNTLNEWRRPVATVVSEQSVATLHHRWEEA
jgi:hypothetical protein